MIIVYGWCSMIKIMIETARLKIIHVITHLDIGGAQDNTLLTVERTDTERFSNMLVSSAGGSFLKRARQLGDRLVLIDSLKREISPINDLRAFLSLVSFFKETRPDIVHTHGSKAGILGRFAAHTVSGCKVIHTVHSFPFFPGISRLRLYLYLFLERVAARLTDRLVFVSEKQAQRAAALGIAAPGGWEVIRSGIDFDPIVPASGDKIRDELDIPAGTPIIGSVGRLFPQKAPELFLEAARSIRDTGRSVRFLYAGDGPLRSEMESLIDRYNMTDCFHLLGWRRDIPNIIDALDIFVISSRWEGVGRALTEALAQGKAVVATDVDGVPELVENSKTGLLVPPDDSVALASAIERLLEDRQLADEIGKNGRNRVREEFSADEMISRLMSLYCNLTE